VIRKSWNKKWRCEGIYHSTHKYFLCASQRPSCTRGTLYAVCAKSYENLKEPQPKEEPFDDEAGLALVLVFTSGVPEEVSFCVSAAAMGSIGERRKRLGDGHIARGESGVCGSSRFKLSRRHQY